MYEHRIVMFGERAFRAINQIVFGDVLPFTSVFNAKKYLSDEYMRFTKAGYVGKPHRMILLNVDSMENKPIGEVITIMFHEMVHLYCEINKIPDTEIIDGWCYHNQAFKEAVEMFGGKCVYVDDHIGYSDTILKPDIVQKIYYRTIGAC